MSGNFVFDVSNPVFISYAFWSAVLVLKMFFMAFLTDIHRHKTHTYASPEDIPAKETKIKSQDADVDRARRAHLNDMENILPFFAIGFLYTLTNPNPVIAINLFRLVAGARIVHTFVYAIYVIPQPARGLAFAGALLPTVYMAVQVMMHFI